MPIDPGNMPFEAFQVSNNYPEWTQLFKPLLESNERFFQEWFKKPPNDPQETLRAVETFVDILIMFLPEIVTIGFILFGFKLMLSPLWK